MEFGQLAPFWAAAGKSDHGQRKAGATVPQEYDTLIAQLESQLSTSLKGLRQPHQPWLPQEWEEEPLQPPLLGQNQQRTQERWTDQCRRLSQEQLISLEQRLCQEKRQLSQALSMMSMMTSHVEEFRTFDDAASLFSLEEWNEWKEVEGLLQKPVMETQSICHVLQDSCQAAEGTILECSDSGDGGKSEPSGTAQSLRTLNTTSDVKYPENKGRKLPQNKKRSIKGGLKKLLCASRKPPSILHSLSEKAPPLPVKTGSETDASSAATQRIAGDREQRSWKRPIICSDCGKLFFSEGCLFRHQEMHRALKPYHCSACGEPFFSQTHLLRHQEIHPELRPYNCTECGKPFISQELLHRHQETHRLRKLYSSTDCGKIFLSQELLHRHQETHRRRKPHNCTECGKIFLSEAVLLRHQETHCVRKPYNRTECGKIFLSEAVLLRHQETHCVRKPYNRTECGKSFKTKSRFDCHPSTHTGAKACECSECGMHFNRKGLLVRHSRTYPGKTPTPDMSSAANPGPGFNTSSSGGCHPAFGETPESPKQRRQSALARATTFGCTKCKKRFLSRHFLNIHRENIHGEARKSLSKQKKKLISEEKTLRYRVHSAVVSSASWH